MNILAISTSTPRWSVWLHRADGWQRGLDAESGRGTGQRASLTRMVWDLLGQADLQPADLQRVVCDVGPGSFTGLRQGLALARALAWAHAIPTLAVGSLQSMLAAPTGEAIVAALPARTGVDFIGVGEAQLWTEQLLPADQALAWWQRTRPAVLRIPEQQRDGALALAALACGARVEFTHPQADRMGQWSLTLPRDAKSELIPRYLSVSEAEVKAGIAVPDDALDAENRQGNPCG